VGQLFPKATPKTKTTNGKKRFKLKFPGYKGREAAEKERVQVCNLALQITKARKKSKIGKKLVKKHC